jgi:hypothetical protein
MRLLERRKHRSRHSTRDARSGDGGWTRELTGDEAACPSCQHVGFATPFTPALGLTGYKALMVSIVALGLWIFEPREIPFSVTAG